MVRIEKFIFSLIIGGVFPLFFLLLSTTIWYRFFRFDINLITLSIPVALVSLFLYVKFVRVWKIKIYDLPKWFLMFVYIMYNICSFGLFMGFPAFNLFWGIVAGYYYGKRIKHFKLSSTKQEKIKHRVALFTSVIIFIVCVATGLIVFIDKYIGYDLQNMLSIETEFSRPLISGITLIGGISLTIIQYFITLVTLNKIIPKKDE